MRLTPTDAEFEALCRDAGFAIDARTRSTDVLDHLAALGVDRGAFLFDPAEQAAADPYRIAALLTRPHPLQGPRR